MTFRFHWVFLVGLVHAEVDSATYELLKISFVWPNEELPLTFINFDYRFKMSIPNVAGQLEAPLSAPKYGTLIPNRIFVGGIRYVINRQSNLNVLLWLSNNYFFFTNLFLDYNSGDTTESELCRVFSAYGNVKSTKIIVDRAGVSKGYGFVTFETEQEALRLQSEVSDSFKYSLLLFEQKLFIRHLKNFIVVENKQTNKNNKTCLLTWLICLIQEGWL